MSQDTAKTAAEVLQAERQRIEQAQPKLVQSYDAFRESYAAYEKMTQQFQPQNTALASAVTTNIVRAA